MENVVTMKAYRVSKSSLEQSREETIDPEIYGAISHIIECCTKDIQPRLAIIPDLQQHAGLLIAGTEQVTLPLLSLVPALRELSNSGTLNDILDNFDLQIVKARDNFLGILELVKS